MCVSGLGSHRPAGTESARKRVRPGIEVVFGRFQHVLGFTVYGPP